MGAVLDPVAGDGRSAEDVGRWLAKVAGRWRTLAEDPGALVYRGRNCLVRVPFEGRDRVVKLFFYRNPLRRLAYRLRREKALRSFGHARRLRDLGFATPAPVGACRFDVPRVEPASAYACDHLTGFVQVRELHDPGCPRREVLVERLGTWAGGLHEAGVRHRDFTVGNVLFDPEAEDPVWHLVDCNRIAFGPVAPATGVRNLVMLEQREGMGERLLAGYCRRRGLDAERWCCVYRRALGRHLARFALKNRTRGVRRALNPFR